MCINVSVSVVVIVHRQTRPCAAHKLKAGSVHLMEMFQKCIDLHPSIRLFPASSRAAILHISLQIIKHKITLEH